MTETRQPPQRTIWVGFGFVTGLLGLALLISFLQINRSRQLQLLPVISPVADFTLTNQDGQLTSLADFTNHVWVADIVFTRCAGPCPRLTGQMRNLQNLLPPDSGAKLVTLTTDPEFDSPAVLKKYGGRFGADFNRWTFLTGAKTQIAALGGDSLKLGSVPVKPADRRDDADLFIHTTIFVLVDKQARLRASFETGGEGVDWTNSVRPQILRAVRQLENE